jgi:outer membrane protein assembly factor BamD
MRRALLLLAALAPLAGCSKNVSITGKLNYGKTAEDNYQAGVEELKGGHYAEATKFLEYVKTKYPFSKFAALAELRIADLKFKQERWPEAAEAYKSFVQLHPTNEDVDYAEYRVGLSHFRDAPEEFFLFPPAYEKDQHSLESAVTDFRDLLQSRPSSKYASDAKARLAEAITRLARHEWYVAEFYYKRKRWAGAAGRLEGLVKNYPDSKYDVEALFKLADVSLKMNEKHRAQKALQEVVVKHPDDPRRPEAEKQLASIR